MVFSKPRMEQEIGRWFDRHYRQRGRDSMRPPEAYPVYLELLGAQPGRRLLDVGCGPGWLLRAGRQAGLEVYGIDLSPEAVRLAAQQATAERVRVSGVTRMDFPDHFFHYLTCIGVFEHFTDVPSAVREMRRVMVPDGKLCIMVPNSRTLYWQFMERFSRGHRESNENAFSLRRWKTIFRDNGFRIEAIHRDEWQITKTLAVLGLDRFPALAAALRRAARRLIPLPLAHQFIFILRLNKHPVEPERGKERE